MKQLVKKKGYELGGHVEDQKIHWIAEKDVTPSR